jgi:hypothetical protein
MQERLEGADLGVAGVLRVLDLRRKMKIRILSGARSAVVSPHQAAPGSSR